MDDSDGYTTKTEKYQRNRDNINWQDARVEKEKFFTHPYDPVVLEELRDDLMKPRNCKEFINYLDGHPHYDQVAECSSNYIRGTHQNNVFQVVGQLNADFQAINDYIKDYVDERDIDNNFETDYTKEWRVYDLKDKEQNDFIPFRHNSELDNQRKHGYTKQYQLLEVTIGKHFNFLKKLDDLLGMSWSKTDINYQPPSGSFPRHVDFLTTGFKRAIEHDSKIANMEFDPLSKGPKKYTLKRLLIPLDDWTPGQMWHFEEHFWSNWKSGQIIDFNWAHCRHGTANAGYTPRPLVKITGLITEDHWLHTGEWKEFTL